jgi:hypothetical protein
LDHLVKGDQDLEDRRDKDQEAHRDKDLEAHRDKDREDPRAHHALRDRDRKDHQDGHRQHPLPSYHNFQVKVSRNCFLALKVLEDPIEEE